MKKMSEMSDEELIKYFERLYRTIYMSEDYFWSKDATEIAKDIIELMKVRTELRKRGYTIQEQMPKIVKERQRFEIPKVKGHIQGNKTIIVNINKICSVLGREPKHLLKFLLKELATSGEIKKSGALIFDTKLPAS